MLKYENIVLRKVLPTEREALYNLLTSDQEWTKFNGPYFPYKMPTLEEFAATTFARLLSGKDMLLITVDQKPIGSVSYYWENEATRWLEVGVIIYDSTYWSSGIGRRALIPWISHLFATLEIERVGLTTWSGNPRMIACAEKLGLRQEACLRKVRYYQGRYYDSVKFGVLRNEWLATNPLD